MSSENRRRAIEAVTKYVAPSEDYSEPLGDLFGRNVFSKSVMKARLPKTVYKSLLNTIEHGAVLESDAYAAFGECLDATRARPGAHLTAELLDPLQHGGEDGGVAGGQHSEAVALLVEHGLDETTEGGHDEGGRDLVSLGAQLGAQDRGPEGLHGAGAGGARTQG